MQAMSKAQGMYRPLHCTSDAAGGKFASLTDILVAVKEALSSNGLAFYQYIELLDEGSGASLLRTTVGHESGQYISTVARVVPGKTFRETFNGIEAYRRLNALLILGIAPSGNDPLIMDDNGVEQQEQVILEELRKPKEVKAKPSVHADTITKDQYTDLMYELEGFDDIAKGIQDFYQITTIADLPKDQYHIAAAKIRKIKKTHEEYVSRR